MGRVTRMVNALKTHDVTIEKNEMVLAGRITPCQWRDDLISS
jgi:hypothetical protein